MSVNCGIIGLPNVGKSTIFNALTAAGAEAANYPFCTIEPNTGVVPVPDARLKILAAVANSAEIIPASVEFVDIAGLVQGASKGEGLGNQFLGHIRSVDAIAHVVRCFDDENIIHVHGSLGPRRDVEIIDTELILSDLAAVEKRFDKVAKQAKSGDKEAKLISDALEIARTALGKGIPLRTIDFGEFNIHQEGFLTSKPLLFVANVLESEANRVAGDGKGGPLDELAVVAKEVGADVVVISGKVEDELSKLLPEEREEFLSELGLKESGLARLARASYKLLKLITFFTVGPKETHAWECLIGSTAPQAAGKIHSDFEKGFIRAEVISYKDYVEYKGEQGSKEKGALRVEGKQYLMQDGDVVHFRFNV